jgi:hypothetical protein
VSRQDHDRAEQIVDRIAEQVAEQHPLGATGADKIYAVRQFSKMMMRTCGIEISDDELERLVRELCAFNFIDDDQAAP